APVPASTGTGSVLVRKVVVGELVSGGNGGHINREIARAKNVDHEIGPTIDALDEFHDWHLLLVGEHEDPGEVIGYHAADERPCGANDAKLFAAAVPQAAHTKS